MNPINQEAEEGEEEDWISLGEEDDGFDVLLSSSSISSQQPLQEQQPSRPSNQFHATIASNNRHSSINVPSSTTSSIIGTSFTTRNDRNISNNSLHSIHSLHTTRTDNTTSTRSRRNNQTTSSNSNNNTNSSANSNSNSSSDRKTLEMIRARHQRNVNLKQNLIDRPLLLFPKILFYHLINEFWNSDRSIRIGKYEYTIHVVTFISCIYITVI